MSMTTGIAPLTTEPTTAPKNREITCAVHLTQVTNGETCTLCARDEKTDWETILALPEKEREAALDRLTGVKTVESREIGAKNHHVSLDALSDQTELHRALWEQGEPIERGESLPDVLRDAIGALIEESGLTITNDSFTRNGRLVMKRIARDTTGQDDNKTVKDISEAVDHLLDHVMEAVADMVDQADSAHTVTPCAHAGPCEPTLQGGERVHVTDYGQIYDVALWSYTQAPMRKRKGLSPKGVARAIVARSENDYRTMRLGLNRVASRWIEPGAMGRKRDARKLRVAMIERAYRASLETPKTKPVKVKTPSAPTRAELPRVRRVKAESRAGLMRRLQRA